MPLLRLVTALAALAGALLLAVAGPGPDRALLRGRVRGRPDRQRRLVDLAVRRRRLPQAHVQRGDVDDVHRARSATCCSATARLLSVMPMGAVSAADRPAAAGPRSRRPGTSTNQREITTNGTCDGADVCRPRASRRSSARPSRPSDTEETLNMRLVDSLRDVVRLHARREPGRRPGLQRQAVPRRACSTRSSRSRTRRSGWGRSSRTSTPRRRTAARSSAPARTRTPRRVRVQLDRPADVHEGRRVAVRHRDARTAAAAVRPARRRDQQGRRAVRQGAVRPARRRDQQGRRAVRQGADGPAGPDHLRRRRAVRPRDPVQGGLHGRLHRHRGHHAAAAARRRSAYAAARKALAKLRFKVPAGKPRVIKLKLTPKARAALRRARKAKVQITLKPKSGPTRKVDAERCARSAEAQRRKRRRRGRKSRLRWMKNPCDASA